MRYLTARLGQLVVSCSAYFHKWDPDTCWGTCTFSIQPHTDAIHKAHTYATCSQFCMHDFLYINKCADTENHPPIKSHTLNRTHTHSKGSIFREAKWLALLKHEQLLKSQYNVIISEDCSLRVKVLIHSCAYWSSTRPVICSKTDSRYEVSIRWWPESLLHFSSSWGFHTEMVSVIQYHLNMSKVMIPHLNHAGIGMPVFISCNCFTSYWEILPQGPLNSWSHSRAIQIISLDIHQQIEFALLSWNCRWYNVDLQFTNVHLPWQLG